jgi:hypothetical protein
MMLDWMPEAIVEKCERVIVLSRAREYCQAQAENHLARYSALTTFGTPQDVTLQELRIEMSFPADDASDALLRR